MKKNEERLVVGDWFESNGQQWQAEFIRGQISDRKNVELILGQSNRLRDALSRAVDQS